MKASSGSLKGYEVDMCVLLTAEHQILNRLNSEMTLCFRSPLQAGPRCGLQENSCATRSEKKAGLTDEGKLKKQNKTE